MTNTLYSFLELMETEKNSLITPTPQPEPGRRFAEDLVLFIESIQIYILTSGKPIILWTHPCHQTDTTGYLPDKRLQTHKQIGKPAAGLSSPFEK